MPWDADAVAACLAHRVSPRQELTAPGRDELDGALPECHNGGGGLLDRGSKTRIWLAGFSRDIGSIIGQVGHSPEATATGRKAYNPRNKSHPAKCNRTRRRNAPHSKHQRSLTSLDQRQRRLRFR